MNGEALGSDVRHIGLTAPIGTIGHMEFVEPYDDLWGFSVEWLGECDVAAILLSRFTKGAIVQGAKPAKLEVAIFSVGGEACTSSGIENRFCQRVNTDLDQVSGERLGEGTDANIRTSIDVKPGEAYGEARRVVCYTEDFVILWLGLSLRINVHGVGVASRHVHFTRCITDYKALFMSGRLKVYISAYSFSSG